jgi:hypothetical protein
MKNVISYGYCYYPVELMPGKGREGNNQRGVSHR